MLECVCLGVGMAQYAWEVRGQLVGVSSPFTLCMHGSWGSNSGSQANCRSPDLLSHNTQYFCLNLLWDIGYISVISHSLSFSLLKSIIMASDFVKLILVLHETH